MQVMSLTETHIKESTIEQIKRNKKKYIVYHNGIEGTNECTEVRILIKEQIPATFTRVNEGICCAEKQLHKYKVILLVDYAPTVTISGQNPDI